MSEENAEIAPIIQTANEPVDMTPEAPVEAPAQTAAIDAKKYAENIVHPVIKSLWDKFEGDVEMAYTWLKNELEKL